MTANRIQAVLFDLDGTLVDSEGNTDWAIAQVMEDRELRENLRSKALQRASEFSFLRNAQETLEVYKEAYG